MALVEEPTPKEIAAAPIDNAPALIEDTPAPIEDTPEPIDNAPPPPQDSLAPIEDAPAPIESASVLETAKSSEDASSVEVIAEIEAEEISNSATIEEEISVTAQPDLNTPECPSCWKALRATDKFCCWCGEAQPNRVLPFLKLCLECSTFLPEKANYCYSCGTDVGYSSRRKVKVPHELFKDEESEFFPRFDA
ncbi:MAG TPA: zinc ribbon domain-containing protein [Drouetiella sp.]